MMAYIDTPRTDAGNATYMTDGYNIENLSLDNSFVSPFKKQDDLMLQLRNNRGTSLRTPRARAALTDRHNLVTIPSQAEFTPLLKSVTKKNQLRRDKENGLPQTPAFLKPDFKLNDSSALPALENSVVYEEYTGSSNGVHDDGMSMPQMSSSSAQSTPLAVLPRRNGEGAVTDQGNLLTLREQENIIDKIEKENFGLKLKIHFLEESLRKAGPGYHEAALKENAELKVDKITMQKELSRTRKTLEKAERDVEAYRIHLEEVQEKIKRKHADQGLKEELEELRGNLNLRTAEVDNLRGQLAAAENEEQDVAKLREGIEELEADLREKDRVLEAREDEIDKLKEQADQDSNEMAELEEEVDSTKHKIEELQKLRNTVNGLEDAVQRANEDAEEMRKQSKIALEEKQGAENDLHKLREELADRSLSTKGLNRQLEDKANQLQHNLEDMQNGYAKLQNCLDEKTRDFSRLQGELRDERLDAEVQEQRLQKDVEVLRHEQDVSIRDRDSLIAQIQKSAKDLQNKSEEKDLLESRHDALTAESQTLQRELNEAQTRHQKLARKLEEERQHSLDNDRNLRAHSKAQTDRLADEIDDLYRKFEDEKSRYAANEEQWGRDLKDLQTQKDKIEQKAIGLQRTVDKLQESEGTLSSRELKLKEALESEKQRHRSEEAILNRQIDELQGDIDEKRHALEQVRSHIAEVKEELRISKREHASSSENVQALEDEIDVLQIALDEEVDRAREDVSKAREEAEKLQQQLQTTKQGLYQAEAAREDAQAKIEKFAGGNQTDHASEGQLDLRLRDVEAQLKDARAEKMALQDQLTQADANLDTLRVTVTEAESNQREAISLRQDLSTSRKKEAEYLQREAAQRDCIRDLKRQIADLERKRHEMELSKLAADSPKSSIDGSARKAEIIEIRRQLAETHQQMKDLRVAARENERESRRRFLAADKESRQNYEEHERQKEQLEQNIADLRLQQEQHMANNISTEQTITRLRTRIRGLETDLHAARLNQNDDRTIAEERKDLHDMLKDAKLEAEDLQIQIQDREQRIQNASLREADLRTQLKRIREERTLQTQRASALILELESLQRRYERSVDKLSHQQQAWDNERKSIVSRVRFPNMSVSSIHAGDSTELKQLEMNIQEKEKRHAAELRGLAKQIQWMRARFVREEGFRYGLAYEKKYLLMHIEMYEACNQIDLRLLEQMGVRPARKSPEKRLRFRSIGMMVLASIKLQRLQQAWAGQKKLQMSLVRKAEQTKRQPRKNIGR